MKKLFLISLFHCTSCIVNCAFSQNPLVKMWDYRYGGTNSDIFKYVQRTSDGGYILAGHSASGISGDKTQASLGGYDYWLLKLDSSGIKQWDKDLGGLGNDELSAILQTADGGYILGGLSYSGISGDKSQPNNDLTLNTADYWLVKTDSLGNKQWDKTIGGDDMEFFSSLQLTADGGYILGDSSKSGVSGDKTEPNRDPGGVTYDYWIVKTDSLGIKQWDHTFGGANSEGFYALKQASDGGYILGGSSDSNVGGDKTDPLWGFTFDYWVVKTDSSGNKQWDRDFGGFNLDYLYAIEQTREGEFIFAGISQSGIGGNRSQPSWGLDDLWFVKTDSAGNILWDKVFGGSDREDDLASIIQTTDNGFLISGCSYSQISGDKSENNLGSEQGWVVKVDSMFNKQWDKTIFTTGHDEIAKAIEAGNGCYTVVNYNISGIGGYKSQPNWGNYDFWIVKFCDTALSFPAAGIVADQFLCLGNCINFLNSSANATSYIWNFPGATPDTSTDTNPTNICYQNPGSYDVQLIATNANGSDTLLLSNYITVYPSPAPQAINQAGDTLFANAGATGYQWYFNGNLIPGATDYFYVAQASGDYNVVATDANGCEVEAAIFNVIASSQEIGIQELFIFPNPVEEELGIKNIKFNPDIYRDQTATEVSIYNVIGEMVPIPIGMAVQLQTINHKPEASIDVSGLPSGLYYIEISTDQKKFRSKFVKQ